jgi:hypothetical protein
MKFILALIMSLSLAQAALAGKYFPDSRMYVHSLFSSQEECDKARAQWGMFNCSQTLRLSPDGSGVMMVTDMLEPVNYEIDGNKLIVAPYRGSSGEIPERLEFTISADERFLTLGRTEWKLDTRDEN